LLVYSGAGLVVLAGFILWEARARHPMMPLRLFANIGFSGANGLTFFLYFALAAVQFYLPMAVISAWGISEVQIALTFLPISVALGLLSGPSGAMADRIGPAPLVTGGALLVAIAYAGLALVMPSENFWFGVFPMMLIMGVGLGLLVSPLSTAVMTSVADADTGTASGVSNAVARMAGFMAVAAMGGVAALSFRLALSGSLAEGLGLSFGLAPEGGLTGAAEASWHQATNTAFATVALINSGLAAVAAVVAWFTLAHKWRKAG
jgi:MFS family permease